jgi:phospholipase/lecithinase/hemolysin
VYFAWPPKDTDHSEEAGLNQKRKDAIMHECSEKRGWISIALAIFTLVAFQSTRSEAGSISKIVAFGDSLSDTGNTYLAAGIPQSPPYYQGHYSNGPIWLEYLAQKLGVAVPTPSLAGGTDYAWGGAETGAGMSFQGTPNIGTQISTFLASNTLDGSELITVWGGANDFLNGGIADPSVPLSNLASEITTLANAGGKLFIVPNLPLLGSLPATNTLPQAQRDALNMLTTIFDNELHSELNQLGKTLGVTIVQLDIEGLVQDATTDLPKYGFTNVTTSALGDGVISGDGYLFWDTVHPTTAGHLLIGNLAAQSVPEPASIGLLVTAGLAVTSWVRGAKRFRAR